MKQGYTYRMLALLGLLVATGCALDEEQCAPCRQTGTAHVRLAEALPATGLETPLYLFRRSAGSQDDYRFDRALGTVREGESLQLPLSEMKVSDYRFLMVAQPDGAPWLSLESAAGGPLAAGTAWNDLRLRSATGQAALDGYCGYTDLTGKTILQEGVIRLKLTRIAGQMIFDFFRTAGSLAQPEGVVSDDVESVLDRVSEIVIEYRNPTTELRFGADGKLTPAALAAEPLVVTVRPDATAFKVTLPQADKGLELYDATLRGSLRIAGAFLLPSDKKIRVRMTFTYFDTTPLCENKDMGNHTETCFKEQQLVLSLPTETATEGLPVAADFFTVNRAGLRCDRIIDVPASGGISAEFDWLKNP